MKKSTFSQLHIEKKDLYKSKNVSDVEDPFHVTGHFYVTFEFSLNASSLSFCSVTNYINLRLKIKKRALLYKMKNMFEEKNTS